MPGNEITDPRPGAAQAWRSLSGVLDNVARHAHAEAVGLLRGGRLIVLSAQQPRRGWGVVLGQLRTSDEIEQLGIHVVTITEGSEGIRLVAIGPRVITSQLDDAGSGLATLVSLLDDAPRASLDEPSVAGTVAALSYMTELRDPYTARHQTGVADLSEAIARRLGMTDNDVHLIREAGVLHDVGKIAVPLEILVRPGAVSDLEYLMLQNHALMGAAILSRAEVPSLIVDVAREHHERLDGSGYPHGLMASDLSSAVRVVTVADVTEAMLHHRPYRPALAVGIVEHELNAGSGVRYDTTVVEVALSLLADGDELALVS